jgi:hypothetical protein
MKNFLLLTLLAAGLLISGCGHSGAFIASNSTQVQLQEGNYRIVAKNITGSAESAYVLGLSTSWGITTSSFGLIPLSGSKTLYKDAREELWTVFEEKHSTVLNKKLALVNIQYDAATTNYLLYTKAKITITADVVEFE